MSSAWISLPRHWRLEDVQASLNVIVSLLSALGIYVFTRMCWQASAAKVSHGSAVNLPTLLTMSSLGEALDTIIVLGLDLFHSRYVKLLLQILVVSVLSVTTLLSGPIARFSTQKKEIVSTLNVTGLLANRWHNSVSYANVEWNLTQTSLDNAGFPLDQILDYLPDTSVPWLYKAEQWNNTWSMSCNYTNLTTVKLSITNQGCQNKWQEIPGLVQILDPDDWYAIYSSSRGYYSSGRWKDALMFLYGYYYTDYNDTANYAFRMAIAAVHMHNFSMVDTDYTGDCQYGTGPIESSSYTMATCKLERPKDTPVDFNSAFPDTGDVSNIPGAYNEYYQGKFKTESITDVPISVITPPELVRFFQTYVVVKDIQGKSPVARNLDVKVRVVQLSTVFLALCVFMAILIIIGLSIYGTYLFIVHRHDQHPPLSKVDWMIQAIEEKRHFSSSSAGNLKRSVTSNLRHEHLSLAERERIRLEFEEATYGGETQYMIPTQAPNKVDEKTYSWFPSPTPSSQILHSAPQARSSVSTSNKAPGLYVAVRDREPDFIVQDVYHPGRTDYDSFRGQY